MKQLRKISTVLEKGIGIFLVISFSILVVACVLQVFTRYILNSSLSWTEELARYAFIWSNLVGAALCVRKHSNAAVSVLTDRLPEKVQIVLDILIEAVIIVISVILIINGTQVTIMTSHSTSSSMHISMAFINSAVPVYSLLIFMLAGINLIEKVMVLLGKEISV
ncbi:MAG: TRAP transporter small permease [Peptococcaceae bacterium]